MATVRFREDHLEDESGNIIQVSFETLKEECLNDSYKRVEIFAIICNAINKVIECQCSRYKIEESKLYLMLQNAIVKDPRYQEAKSLQVERQKKLRQNREAYVRFERNLKYR